jgi:serine/threonine-protein phosphatase 2A regulatory subunit A
MTSMLTCVQTLAPVVTLDIISTSILPIMDRLVSDPIPNIRFNVAKSYIVLIDTLRKLPEEGTIEENSGSPSPKGMELVKESILPNLEKLQGDDDADVRYFAGIAARGVEGGSERMDTE